MWPTLGSRTAKDQIRSDHSLFHSRLKTVFFCKSFPLQPFFFFFRTDYTSPQTFTVRRRLYRAYDIGCVVVRKWLQNALSTLLTTPVPWSRSSTCYPCSLMETMVILHDRLGLYRPTRQSPSDLQCTQQSALDAASYDNAPCRCSSIQTPSRQRICWVADRSTSPRRTVRPIRERY